MSKNVGPREVSSSDLAYVGEVGLVLPSPPSRKFQRWRQTTNVHGRDKDAEISKEKAATTALNALQQLSWPH